MNNWLKKLFGYKEPTENIKKVIINGHFVVTVERDDWCTGNYMCRANFHDLDSPHWFDHPSYTRRVKSKTIYVTDEVPQTGKDGSVGLPQGPFFWYNENIGPNDSREYGDVNTLLINFYKRHMANKKKLIEDNASTDSLTKANDLLWSKMEDIIHLTVKIDND